LTFVLTPATGSGVIGRKELVSELVTEAFFQEQNQILAVRHPKDWEDEPPA